MNNFKRIIATALSVLMIMGTLVLNSGAEEFNDVGSDYKYSEQINILSDIGVTQGTGNGAYSPDKIVNREQMALLLYRLMVGNDNAGRVNTTPFTDLRDDTYSGAISWAYSNGYILGTSESTFAPGAGITLRDAMAMLVRILGHETDKMPQGYPWTYINSAVKLGLDLELEDVKYDQDLTRGEIAAILYNALTAEYLVPKTMPNGVSFFESTTIIEKIFGYKFTEATIVATNDYSMADASTVVKDGYVSLSYNDNDDTKLITVKYDDLGIKGDANSNLGLEVKLVYSIDQGKNIKVLGATEVSREETLTDNISVYENEKTGEFEYTLIGDTRYQVVEELSDSLSTNANEILVYLYSENAELEQITSNEELKEVLGVYEARLIFKDRNDETASALIIKPFGFDILEISNKGRYNIANDYTEKELEGGLVNENKAEDGDYVLYYFNKENKRLEIKDKLHVSASQTVKRVTEDTAKIGDKSYTLGNEALGISAESIADKLNVGDKVRFVAVNGMILAIEDSIEDGAASNYLVTLSTAKPVYSNNKYGYVVKVNIDGEVLSVFTETDDVEAGLAYRYTEDEDVYTLIPYTVEDDMIVSGGEEFVQNSGSNKEIAVIIDDADNSEITKGTANYTLDAGDAEALSSIDGFGGSIKFITDENTIIIIGNGEDKEFDVKRGKFDGNISIEDGAYVAAVLDNEAGSVEALRYLYISDGSFNTSESSANTVKVLEYIGVEYEGGKVYKIYNVLDLENGEVKEMYSLSSSLVEGGNYKINTDGTVSATEADIANGIITGYTSSTITVGSDTLTLADDVNIYSIDEEFEVNDVKLENAYLSNVEYIIDDDKVVAIIVLGDAPMSAAEEDGNIVVTLEFDLDGINDIEVKSLKLDGENVEIAEETLEGNTLTITPEDTLEEGRYTLIISLNSKGTSTIKFTI